MAISTHKMGDVRSGYCKETGVYYSKHDFIEIPTDPWNDAVSFVFSQKEKHQGNKVAFVDCSNDRKVTYKELPVMVRSVAAGLDGLGIRQGDVLLIVSGNSIQFPVIFLAALSIGAVVTTMNPLNTSPEIVKQSKDSKAKIAFTVPSLLRKVKATGLPIVLIEDHHRPHGSDDPLPSACVSSYDRLLACNPAKAPTVRINQNDTAALLYSSGTTGVSKGVIITHRNIIAMVLLLVRFVALQYNELEVTWEKVYLAIVPMFHVYGLVLFATGLIAMGTTTVIMPKIDLDEMLRAVQRYKVTHLPLVPPIILALSKSPVVDKYDLSSLRLVSSGAAPLSKEVVQVFVDRFPHIEVIQGYGLTETTGVGAVATGEGTKRYGSVGLIVPNMEAKVIDVDNGNSLPPNQKGELWLRGPVVMRGYFSNEEATSSTIDREGWLHTGDLCYFDQDGFLYIVDRLKELIKYKGFQVAPAELEAVLLSHPDILDAAVVPMPDEEAGQIPVAYVVKKAESPLRAKDVILFVGEQVAPYKKVRRVAFVNSIPKSAAGKILRKELVALGTSKL
eukprot:Gb_33460 [translate_table: standard]